MASPAPAPIDRTFRIGLALGGALGVLLGIAAGSVIEFGWLIAFAVGVVLSGLMWDLLSRPRRKLDSELAVAAGRFAAPADLNAYRNVVTLAFMGPMALTYLALQLREGGEVLSRSL